MKQLNKNLIALIFLMWAFMLSAMDGVDLYVSPMEGGCVPLFVTASNNSNFPHYQGVVYYRWSINGDSVSVDPSMIDTTFNKPGNYQIALEAFDTNGYFLGRAERNVNAKGVDKFHINPNDTVCPGEKVEFGFFFPGDIYNARWDFGGGDIRYGHHHSKVYETEGTYTIELMIDNECESKTLSQDVTVSNAAKPDFDIHTSGRDFCPDDPIVFKSSYHKYEVQWLMDDGATLEGPEVKYSFSEFGPHTVEAEVTNLCGQTTTVIDTVYIKPNAHIWADFHFWFENGNDCPRSPIRFEPNTSGYFEWKFGDGASSSAYSPVHNYADSGHFKVTMIATNGCGNSDTAMKHIDIRYKEFDSLGFEPFFFFEDDFSGKYSDTLKLCPGESFSASVDNWGGDNSTIYKWFFSNGIQKEGEKIHHKFINNGLFKISLRATDACRRPSKPYSKWVRVDPLIKPEVELMYAPAIICPTETVYFWDELLWDEKAENVYDIDFGDGASENGITDVTNTEPRVLASHSYAAIGAYEFEFKATNNCGNSVIYKDSVWVTNDASIEPFYYISNSTGQEQAGTKHGTEMWDAPVEGNEHEFVLDVQWMDWDVSLNDTFYIYAWYGGFYPMEGESGDPDGMAMFTSSDINTIDSFRIYVPINMQGPPEVGFAVGWFCNPGEDMDDEPDSWGMMMAGGGMPVNALPITENGVTRSREVIPGPIQLSPWNGICRSESVKGEWMGKTGEQFVFLSFWKDNMDSLGYYHIEVADDEFRSNSMSINSGGYVQEHDTAVKLFPSDMCSDSSEYEIMHMEHGFKLVKIYDNCGNQVDFLDSVMFKRHESFNNNGGPEEEPACPGDPVAFQIVGGKTYVWHFGDGTTSTEQFPMHAYDTAGMYEAFVIATNNCGRTDTLHSPVKVVDNYLPRAYFYLDNWDLSIGDSVEFIPDAVHRDNAEFFKYYWDFGDGNTDTNIIATHVYEEPGEYIVSLMVENGCGYNEEKIFIFVKDFYGFCEVESRFDFEVSGKTVAFHNFSLGDSLVVSWDFGDGETSDEWEPTHTFEYDGVYEVCLSVYDIIQECAATHCIEIVVGQLDCIADFSFTVNNKTNTVRFFDKSTSVNLVKHYWDFGDYQSSFKKDPIHTYPEPGWYWVSLAIEDPLTGCFDYRSKEIWVGEIDTSTSCFVDWSFFIDTMTVNFYADVTGNITDGYWDFGDGYFGHEPYISHTYEEPGTYEVCVYVFDSISGCQAEKCEEITIGKRECIANFAHAVDSATGVVEFFNKSIGDFTEIYMDYGDGTFSATIDTTHTYPEPGEYTACLIVYNETNQCYDELCKLIKIPGVVDIPECKVTYTFIPKSENSLSVQFKENSLTKFSSWYWQFDDGTYSIKQDPLKTYAKSGVYNVCLTAYSDSLDCFDEVCRKITVEGTDTVVPLVASYKAIINMKEGKVKFRNTSTGKFTHAYWIFGDGDVASSLDTITHDYSPGIYKACLIVTNANTGETDEYCDMIIMGEQPCLVTADFKHFIDASTNTVKLTDLSVGAPNKWFWTFGDGSTSSKPSPVKKYKRAGYYLITLAVRDTIKKCSDFTSKLLQVGSADCLADFEFSVDPTTREVKFTNTSIGDPSLYYWLFSDGASYTDENPVHTFEKEGLYTAGFAISGSGGLCNSFAKKQIQVGKVKCNAEFEAYVDSVSNTAYFEANLIGEATNLVWTFGDGGIAHGKKAQHKYKQPGFYTVALNTFNKANGCMDYVDQTVLIGQSGIDVEPDFFYRGNDGSLIVDFVDQSIGDAASYAWDFGDGTTSTDQNPQHTYAKSGFYNVCLSVSTSGNVTNTKCEKIRVSNTNTECLAQFIYNVDSATKAVSFTDLSYGKPDSWMWKLNDGQTSTDTNPTFTCDTAGLYRVKLVISNSTTGCKSVGLGVINVAKGSTGLIAAFAYDVDSSLLKATEYPVDLLAYPGKQAAHYKWTLGDGNTKEGVTEFTHYYQAAGTYNVCFTVTDQVTNESATECQDVTTTTTTLPETLDAISAFTASPNPFVDYTQLRFTLEEAGQIEMDVYDETGRHVSNIMRTHKDAGTHVIDWSGDVVDSGIYIIQLKTKDSSVIKQISVVKQ